MSPAVTLHSLLSLSGGFKVLHIIFPREYELLLSLWSSLHTLPSVLGIAWLSGTQPHVLQLLFLLCPGETSVWRRWGRGCSRMPIYLNVKTTFLSPALPAIILPEDLTCFSVGRQHDYLGNPPSQSWQRLQLLVKGSPLFCFCSCIVIYRLDLDFKDPSIS